MGAVPLLGGVTRRVGVGYPRLGIPPAPSGERWFLRIRTKGGLYAYG